jgi:Ca2+/H+ antiporter, TMEM165/GDT1 family
MDWKLLGTTFLTIFLAELGDKTQLTTLTLAASGSSRWIVFAGSAVALVLSSLLAVLLGEVAARHIPVVWLQRVSGAILVVMGVLLLLSKGEANG